MPEEPTNKSPTSDDEIFAAMRERAAQQRAAANRAPNVAVAKSATASGTPPNPYIAALVTIAVVGLLIGVIAIVVGVGNAGSYSPSLGSSHGDSGIGEISIGGSLVGFGLTAVFIALGAQAVLWALARTDKATT